jgi:hypothetical protein
MKIFDIAFHAIAGADRARFELTRHGPRTLVVGQDESALAVAERADQEQARMVVVVDHANLVCGVLEPRSVKEKISKHLGVHSTTLTAVLREFETRPQERIRNYHHEWLNLERPILVWCEKGSHFTAPPKCEFH